MNDKPSLYSLSTQNKRIYTRIKTAKSIKSQIRELILLGALFAILVLEKNKAATKANSNNPTRVEIKSGQTHETP
ncbi:hypothetical protein [Agaribacterium sp. ZY112]|uniref:hypothetical protein n=1 Tax=Agaribacterium sp. ZY112 TaxID=3233574 RepID=UPI00352457C2